MIHKLDIWPCFYDEIISGKKRFELRQQRDRNFRVGDVLHLKNIETRETIAVDVLYIFKQFGLQPDWCCMSIDYKGEVE
jgi:uncharacterized protein YqfB (UPF0267 family)